jgi:putative glutathione S-transferase
LESSQIYYLRFKLNHSLVRGYRHLWRWLCDVYALPGIAEASPLDQMKQGYFGRTDDGKIPLGPPGYPELYTQPGAFFPEGALPV